MARSGRPLKVDPIIDGLYLDIEKGNNDVVIRILEEKGIDSFDRYKRTVLINASFYGNLTLLQWCLNHGADINFQDNSGMSGLHFAAQEGKVEVAHVLVQHGANVNLTDSYGKTPLLTALLDWKKGANVEMVKYLVENGSDVHVKLQSGISAYDLMEEELREELRIEKVT